LSNSEKKCTKAASAAIHCQFWPNTSFDNKYDEKKGFAPRRGEQMRTQKMQVSKCKHKFISQTRWDPTRTRLMHLAMHVAQSLQRYRNKMFFSHADASSISSFHAPLASQSPWLTCNCFVESGTSLPERPSNIARFCLNDIA